jgi:hypothetical protein
MPESSLAVGGFLQRFLGVFHGGDATGGGAASDGGAEGGIPNACLVHQAGHAGDLALEEADAGGIREALDLGLYRPGEHGGIQLKVPVGSGIAEAGLGEAAAAEGQGKGEDSAGACKGGGERPRGLRGEDGTALQEAVRRFHQRVGGAVLEGLKGADLLIADAGALAEACLFRIRRDGAGDGFALRPCGIVEAPSRLADSAAGGGERAGKAGAIIRAPCLHALGKHREGKAAVLGIVREHVRGLRPEVLKADLAPGLAGGVAERLQGGCDLVHGGGELPVQPAGLAVVGEEFLAGGGAEAFGDFRGDGAPGLQGVVGFPGEGGGEDLLRPLADGADGGFLLGVAGAEGFEHGLVAGVILQP